MSIFLVVIILLQFSQLRVLADLNPLSDEFINSINDVQSTWTAGRNFEEDTSYQQLKQLVGVHPDNYKYKLPAKVVSPIKDLPKNFDAREKWPKCKSLNLIRDQGACGSCWAVAAVGAMSDRICIHSKENLQTLVSAEDLLSCCRICGLGCSGGFIAPAWIHWELYGISSGGLYNTTDGCRAYSIEPCEHFGEGNFKPCKKNVNTPKCKKECDKTVKIDYNKSLSFGQMPYFLQTVEDIMTDIYQNGPVEAFIKFYEDLLSYKSGIYQHVTGNLLGGHAVKILGWGVENETDYWLAANSFNSDWGDKGLFKIIRGRNHCEIESDAVAALPKFVPRL